ncbi:MAG: phospho-N-acetylmuramoyl-pentapeptide-transferase [Clostridia bacterium]|nr:phospho-N-acetylmuramoyl-pentapeptide-transferase [Clostridia bacterium]
MKPIYLFLLTLGATFALTAIAERILIPILRAHKIGQYIFDLGPRKHKDKEGTPMMGGIGFILAILVVLLVRIIVMAVEKRAPEDIPLVLTIAYGVANGIVGFVDDYNKLVKKQGEGLTRTQKLVLQFVLAAAYLAVMGYTGFYPTDWKLPFTDSVWHLGWAAYPLGAILLVGVVNAGNINDGIDGLFSSVVLIDAVYYAVLAFVLSSEQLLLPSAMLIGAAAGFLLFNFHPAKVFMGDTGSLFFGGVLIALAFQAGDPIGGLLVMLPVIFEMLTSLLQILFFKLTKKRLFSIAPFHHALQETHGWNEYQIVALFDLLSILFCVLAWISR